MWSLWWLGVLVGCGNPVEKCDSFPRSDCCDTNEQCLDFYGADFPFCVRPASEDGGTCSECEFDRDCPGGKRCDIDRDNFGVCL